MNNNKPNDVRLVPVELLERLCMRPRKDSSAVNHQDIVDRGQAQAELRAILAQPADQQGEPFAWMCFDFEGGHDFTEDAERAERWRKSLGEKYKGCLTPLYRHAQPATAKVVLPERTTDTQSCSDIAKRIGLYGSVNVWQLGEIWNACLDEVAKLNGGQS